MGLLVKICGWVSSRGNLGPITAMPFPYIFIEEFKTVEIAFQIPASAFTHAPTREWWATKGE
jgi:hypothetical protein